MEHDRAYRREKARRLRAAAADGRAFLPVVMDLLHYDPETGIFRWRKDRIGAHGKVVANAGDEAGIKTSDGYLSICIGVHHRAHRLAWLIMTGDWPPGIIDHKDRRKSNNRWTNLRLADQVLNQHNRVRPAAKNISGLLGVTMSNGKYPQAWVRVNRRRIYLGTFDTPQAAHAVYMAAKQAVIEHGPGIADTLAVSAPRRR